MSQDSLQPVGQLEEHQLIDALLSQSHSVTLRDIDTANQKSAAP